MQDGASIHWAGIIVKWINEMEIEIMDWPPYSPDLNPIENLWKLLKDQIVRSHPEFKTIKDNNEAMAHLIRCAKEAWEDLAPELLNKLAEGMQKRADAVLKAKGW